MRATAQSVRKGPERWRLALCLLPAAASCYHARTVSTEQEPVPVRDVSYAEEKRQLVMEMELRMNEMMRRYEQRIAAIREQLGTDLAALQPPARLMAIDRSFRAYGAAEEERYDAEIDGLVAVAVEATEQLVGRERSLQKERLVGAVELEAFRIAAEVGGDGQGAGYGFISGVQEVDDRARAIVELLQGIADVESLEDMGEIRREELLELNPVFQHDLTEQEIAAAAPECLGRLERAVAGLSPRVGRLTLFRSDVLDGYRMKGQDTTGVALAFQNDRLPEGTSLAFVQARRTRVVRGGMVVQDHPWQLDPTTGRRDGRLALRGDLVNARILASEPLLPAVNEDHELFAQLQDFTIIYDYKTGLLEEASGELLGALSWQLQWIVSARGNVRVLPAAEPSFDPDARLLLDLQRAAAAGVATAAAHAAPNPSDRMSGRRPATTAPFPIPDRELPDGTTGPLVELTESGDLRVRPAGRTYIVNNRVRILTRECGLFSFLDGQRNRYVLAVTELPEGSPLTDLGLRRGDAILSINGASIERFSDLWGFFIENPRLPRYDLIIDRNGAQRRQVYLVEGADQAAPDEAEIREEITGEMAEILARLFKGGK